MATRKTKPADTPSDAAEVKKPRRTTKAETTEGAAPKRTRKPKAVEAAVTEAPAEQVAAAAPEQQAAVSFSEEERLRHIQEAAYYIAERRGFAPGNEHDDWVQAEMEVAARLSK